MTSIPLTNHRTAEDAYEAARAAERKRREEPLGIRDDGYPPDEEADGNRNPECYLGFMGDRAEALDDEPPAEEEEPVEALPPLPVQHDPKALREAELARQEWAERLLRREATIQRKRAQATRFIDTEIQEAEAALAALRERRKEIASPFDNLMERCVFQHSALIAWARETLIPGGPKTLKLAYGSVSFRQGRESFRFGDPEDGEQGETAAVEFAAKHGLYDALKPKLTPLVNYLKEIGEEVPGLYRVPAGETVTVKLNDE